MYAIRKITAQPTIDFAAEELKKYVRMMMPRCGEVEISYDPEAKDGFRIGLMADFALDMSDAEDILLDDIVYIDTDENGGIIAGSNPGATLIAVYRYLRMQGCRWLFPGIDGEWIPVVGGLKPVSYRKLADYRYRGQCNEGAEFQQDMLEVIDFSPKIGLNTFMIEFDNPYVYYERYYSHDRSSVRESEQVDRQTILQYKRQCEAEIQKRGLHFHDMGHAWTAIPFGVNPALGWDVAEDTGYPEEMLQYVAMLNGKREAYQGVPLNTNICMSNPEARRIMAEYIADYAQTQNNVDFLHVWLSDGTNNCCECEQCRKKNVTDWYIVLLNDIDAELTRRGLDTHLVFIAYHETFWAPVTERLNNKKRFTMLCAPGSRRYDESYSVDADPGKIEPYRLNNNVMPKGMAACMAHLKEWREVWEGDCYCYEYHFMLDQYNEPSGLYMARLLHEDIVSLKKHGLMGIVEDGSQRSFFPNGLAFYTYGETLFDSGVTFDGLVEDYFSHAYGADWKKALEFLTQVRDRLGFDYFYALKGKKPDAALYHSPEQAELAAQVHSLAAAFAPVVRKNLRNRYRATQVAWQLMQYFMEYACGVADIAICIAQGDGEGARRQTDRLMDAFSRHEIYIERYYDQWLVSVNFARMKMQEITQ